MALSDDQKLSVQVRLAAAMRGADAKAMAELAEPDAVAWHNHDEQLVPYEASVATVGWMHRNIGQLTWEDTAVLSTPNGFVWQSVLGGSTPAGDVRAPLCMVVTLSSGGLIQRIEEYLDPAGFAALAS